MINKNYNTLLIGGAGSGKTQNYVKPTILNADCSYIIHDPVGEIFKSTGDYLKSKGYDIQILDLMGVKEKYNPFHYIETDEDVIDMVNCIMQNNNQCKSNDDPFLEKYETSFLLALCFYLRENFFEKYQNFSNILKLINRCEVIENNPEVKNDIDILMDELEEKNPNSMAVRYWKIFKLAPSKTAMSILVSTGVRLSKFNTHTIQELTKTNTLNLENIGDKKTALFVIPSNVEDYSFITSIFYSQLMNILSKKKHTQEQIKVIFDDFPNIGYIPNIDEKMKNTKNISYILVIQSLEQLFKIYGENFDDIFDDIFENIDRVYMFKYNDWFYHKKTTSFILNKMELSDKEINVWKSNNCDCICFTKNDDITYCNKNELLNVNTESKSKILKGVIIGGAVVGTIALLIKKKK